MSFQLARHNKELQAMLKPGGTYGEGDEALEFYAKHTAQIEVSSYMCSLFYACLPSPFTFAVNISCILTTCVVF